MTQLMLECSHYVTIHLREVILLVTQQEFQRILQILEEVNRKVHHKPVTALNGTETLQ